MTRAPGYRQVGDWRKTRTRILTRDEGRCYLCGGEAVTADHVIPVSQGGNHGDDNLRAICKPCHDAKSEVERRAGIARRRPRVNRNRAPEAHPNSAGRPSPSPGSPHATAV